MPFIQKSSEVFCTETRWQNFVSRRANYNIIQPNLKEIINVKKYMKSLNMTSQIEWRPTIEPAAYMFNATDLKWSIRYQIALGVARGLVYLHDSCQDCIIHCDIKPENVLLDASFVPKIADFGMAKFLGREFSRVLTTMRGTIGYISHLNGLAELLLQKKLMWFCWKLYQERGAQVESIHLVMIMSISLCRW
jgi:serine/threonine protein kinase